MPRMYQSTQRIQVYCGALGLTESGLPLNLAIERGPEFLAMKLQFSDPHQSALIVGEELARKFKSDLASISRNARGTNISIPIVISEHPGEQARYRTYELATESTSNASIRLELGFSGDPLVRLFVNSELQAMFQRQVPSVASMLANSSLSYRG